MPRAPSPYRLPDGPVAIQFSGGRSSGYMLRHILDAHDGQLPADAHVLFQNTGRERQETLDFVRDCGERWGVPIAWLEYDPGDDIGFRRVGPGTNIPASVNGEPFERLIGKRSFLPNPVTKFCTQELKIGPSRNFMHKWIGYERWVAVIGIRYDERRRAAKTHKSAERERWTVAHPMIEAKVTKRHVAAFWRAQPFDLALPNINGSAPEGNCDGCFLKSVANRAWLARNHPERAAWWARLESETGGTFDKRISWAEIIRSVEQQPDWVFETGAHRDLYCDSALGGCHD